MTDSTARKSRLSIDVSPLLFCSETFVSILTDPFICGIFKAYRPAKVPMAFKMQQMKGSVIIDTKVSEQKSNGLTSMDSLNFLAVESVIHKSTVTNSDYVEWLGKPVTMRIVNYRSTEAYNFIGRPKGYWIPPSCDAVIERLKWHGIKMTTISQAQEVNVEMYRVDSFKFEDDNHIVQPFEGHMQVN